MADEGPENRLKRTAASIEKLGLSSSVVANMVKIHALELLLREKGILSTEDLEELDNRAAVTVRALVDEMKREKT